MPDSMMYTEMVNATGLHYERATQDYEVDPNERPISIQLFDCRPDLAQAAQMAVEGLIRWISTWVAL